MSERPYLLGLTGSIAMGKSTTAQMFRDAGLPVWDADATVHDLYSTGGAAVPEIARLAPQAIIKGAVDRSLLSNAIQADTTLLPRIEAAVHPLVAADRTHMIEKAEADIVVLDIPLLFETGADKGCDGIAVVTAPEEVQRARAMARPSMTEQKLAAILRRQLPDAEKRALADFQIDTSQGLEAARSSVEGIIETIRAARHA